MKISLNIRKLQFTIVVTCLGKCMLFKFCSRYCKISESNSKAAFNGSSTRLQLKIKKATSAQEAIFRLTENTRDRLLASLFCVPHDIHIKSQNLKKDNTIITALSFRDPFGLKLLEITCLLLVVDMTMVNK